MKQKSEARCGPDQRQEADAGRQGGGSGGQERHRTIGEAAKPAVRDVLISVPLKATKKEKRLVTEGLFTQFVLVTGVGAALADLSSGV